MLAALITPCAPPGESLGASSLITALTLEKMDIRMVKWEDGQTSKCSFIYIGKGVCVCVSRTVWVSRYQEDKTSLDLNKTRDAGVLGWQRHQLDYMQTICTTLQTDNHTNTSSLNLYRLDALPDALTTVSKHRRHSASEVTTLWSYTTHTHARTHTHTHTRLTALFPGLPG